MSRRLVAGATLGALSQLSAAGLLLTSAWLIVRAAEHPPVMYLMVAIVSVRFFGLGRAVFRYGERLLTHDVALARQTDERVAAYRELDRVAPAGLPGRRRGDLISRVVGDVDSTQDRLLRLRLPWLHASITSVVVVVILGLIGTTAGMILAVHVGACMLFVRIVVPWTATRSAVRIIDTRGEMSAEASVLALSSRDLVAYGATDHFEDRIRDTIADIARAETSSAWASGLGSAFVLACTGVTVALLALLTPVTSPVVVGVLLLAPVALLEPLQALADAERLRPAIAAARLRLDAFAAVVTPTAEPRVPVLLPAGTSIRVERVSVGWGRRLTEPVSFTLGRGGLVGVAGPSGVGKSTLALALTKLVTPWSGAVLIDGIPYDEVAGTSVRTRVGLCGQDDAVLDTSIKENLRVGDPDADLATMMSALDRAGLGEFVRGLPDGLETMVGEQGSRLSGGERQRLGIARLLLGGHDILILDEPTEHLDQATADALMDDIITLAKDHGVLLISHSATVLAVCDEVVHLKSSAEAGEPATPAPTRVALDRPLLASS